MVNAKIAYEANVQPGISAKDFRNALDKGLVGSANFRERKASLDSNTGTVTTYPSIFLTEKGVYCAKSRRCKSIFSSQLCFCL